MCLNVKLTEDGVEIWFHDLCIIGSGSTFKEAEASAQKILIELAEALSKVRTATIERD